MYNKENEADEALLKAGYIRELKTIDIAKANVQSLYIMIPVLLLYGIPFYLIWNNKISFKEAFDMGGYLNLLVWVIIFIAGIIAHELVHGITWSFFTKKGFKAISFGVLKKTLTPYCHCNEPLLIKQYITGAITPFIFVGLIPGIAGIITGSVGWLVFGIFYTIGAIGDFMIINLLKKEKMTDYALDHPSEAGCYVYRKQTHQA
ncbi:MAG: DUF3267 domain-containing protein [Niabella sp.]